MSSGAFLSSILVLVLTGAGERDDELVRIGVPVRDGEVNLRDVFREVSRARGFDGDALAGDFPSKTIEVTGVKGRLLVAGVNLILAPAGIRLGVSSRKAGDAEDKLEIVLDRAAQLASERRIKRVLRKAVLGALGRERREYGIEADKGWKEAPAGKSLVVLVHGVQSSTEPIRGILDEIRAEGFPCAEFRYPNDQPVAESAKLLSRSLRKIAAEQPGRKVALLAHSMGGLVSREAIENPELDPGNVERLIMVATPNQGSVLARLSYGVEIWEHAAGDRDRDGIDRFYAAIEDGLCEAADDLEPDSLFLKRLNGRQRNAKVSYSLFLGTGAPLSDASLQRMRKELAEAGSKNRFARFFGSKLDTYLADLDEVVRGKGDGAVALKRGKLDGVSDVVVLEFDHLTLVRDPATADARKLRKEILRRLKTR